MAGPNDFTGQNIQDTYQRVLQLSSSNHITDGTGSVITNLTVDGTGSFGRLMCTSITASTGQFDEATIFLGTTPFNKAELDTLKDGKTINTSAKNLKDGDTNKTNIVRPDAVMHPDDDSTYSKYTTTGRIGTYVSGTLFHDLNLNGNNNYVVIGDGRTDIQLKGNINEATLDGGTF